MRESPKLFLMAAAALVAGLCGCREEVSVTYSVSDDVRELPPPYRKQIASALQEYFGTAATPRLRVPDFDAQGDAEKPPLVNLVSPEKLARGRDVFNRRCWGCHGHTGDGRGPAAEYLYPKPRDYRRGLFKFTSTPYGMKPRRTDLIRVIRFGARGTSMPAFRWLADEDVDALVAYVMMLSFRGELEYRLAREAQDLVDPEAQEPELIEPDYIPELVAEIADSWKEAEASGIIPLTVEPPFDEESIAKGQQIFQNKACKGCHKVDAAGGLLAYEQLIQSASPDVLPEKIRDRWETLARNLMSPAIMAQLKEKLGEDVLPDNVMDNWGNFAFAANLTSGMLHGGRRPIDIYRRLYTGVTGTPMPSFAQHELFTEDPDNFWHVVHFVIATTHGRPVPVPEDSEDGDDADEQ